ncbi:hypothetical protein NDU88_008396 [Pleurodeles waltl]|uniref:Uncharacterized protein n=1 Tax=Pleurodeles waltl TaxID=8319 RepID=A0AAV7PWI7_PLEWA|nr:hypothetical protein NDU88_008396 [Pleurodeles waltl]
MAEHTAGDEAPNVRGTPKSAREATGLHEGPLTGANRCQVEALQLAASEGSLWAHLLVHSQCVWRGGPIGGLNAGDPPEPGRKEKARRKGREEQ